MTKVYPHSIFFLFLMLLCACFSANATIYPFSATYSGSQESSPNASTGTGTIMGTYNDVTNIIIYTINFSGLTSPTLTNGNVPAHFHAPASTGANASVVFGYTGFPVGVTSGSYSNFHLLTTQAQEDWLFAGLWYSNIHTDAFPGGEIRAQIILGTPSTSMLSFNRTYSGANEVPANNSAATGTISGTYDSVTNRLFYAINFTGLTAPASAAHFHGDTIPGANVKAIVTYTGFPNATSGSYAGTRVLSIAEEKGLLGGLWYSNIHNSVFPGGEIRTQIFFNEIAEPTLSCPTVISVNNALGVCFQTVTFSAAATGTPTPTLFYRIGSTKITSPHVFPVDTTTVFVTAINGGGYKTCSFNVVVTDNEPPVIHNLAAIPNKLWSPNHKMNDVAVNYTTTDNCGVPITCSLTVASNEVANGKGDGNTGSDWVVVDDHNVKLRAEKSGKGSDRVYTITTTCTDQHGNVKQSTTTVRVPHDARSSARMGTNAIQVANNKGLKLGVINNPSNNQFTLNIQTDNNQEKITVRVFDLHGRMVESKANLQGSQLLKIGSDLKPGFYVVELRQGKQVQKSKLVKAK